MNTLGITRVLAVATLATLTIQPSAQAQDIRTATGTFVAGGTTDTPKPVDDTHPNGQLTFTQAGPGAPIKVTGYVTGLDPYTKHVAVPYKDGLCTPVPGVTAYPSGVWTTDGTGSATVNVSLDPQSINPLGQFDVSQTRSVSIRQVAVASVGIPPRPTPNVPLLITEGCDGAPSLT